MSYYEENDIFFIVFIDILCLINSSMTCIHPQHEFMKIASEIYLIWFLSSM